MASIHSRPKFHVGDHVQLEFGFRRVTGVVVEDRGPIGGKGRHLFRVNVPADPFEPMELELPEDEMTAAEEETATPLEKENVIEYLISGGLISILRSNISGGKNQPRVWLRPDTLGNVTHTFVPERGQIGGQIPPFAAVHDNKVFMPKRDEVLAYLRSFGLNAQEAEQVVSRVGTAP